ncbi:elongation factor P 5-aminopentanone reductase [Ornithinibacillus halophilus]|uniref:3-oxoacyl-[acyl-carrier protein] reductase n=1 Tax=Ornithinibacillus halophilus TaxID=930117 RepID=A0A1M5CEG0_9BACI|nr:SDR family oxidoreductase [Ornithinibacillus halophilus]SHF53091.1 3-oxoacyl-[acyl-carrier protein] reductase [Ornithinibacillus halophilus]
MGKNILIIGASGDIGSAIAKLLGKKGHRLLLHYHTNGERMSNLREQLDREVILSEIKADLTNESEIKSLITNIVFPVDIIVFASGRAHYGLFQETPEEVINEMLTIHVKAPMMITKHLLPPMIRNNYGKIILISSIWGDIGASHEVLYSTVKGAQNSFVKSLAKEVGPSGININAVSPGFIDTKMNQHLLTEEREAIFSEIPLNRPGQPKEVAELVHFLTEDKSSYIQGEVIRINGGW